MDLAAQNGHIHVLEFLLTHRREGCKRAVDLASQYGRLDVLRWLWEHMGPSNDNIATNMTSPTATLNASNNVARDNRRLVARCSIFGFDWALGNGHMDGN